MRAIRVFESTDFPEATPELLEKEKALNAKMSARAKK
jgi:hypothetical protein